MDGTFYEIVLELAELNCSFIEHFQDTLYENASLALLSADGRMECSVVLFRFFLCVHVCYILKNTLQTIHFLYVSLASRFIL